jgi:hypothetical protein
MPLTFVILSVLDLLLTGVILSLAGEQMEANPVAAAIYRQLGLAGLTAFKMSMISFVLHIYKLAYAPRPMLARSMLGFACLITGVAVTLGVISNEALLASI